jgi:prepilin peptidase CpaA
MENVTALLQAALIASYAGILFWAGITDCRSWTIPNRFPAALVGLYPAWVLANAGAIAWPTAVLAAAVVFAIGAIFFAQGWMGGGDVKLMSAAMLWAAPVHGFAFLAATALAGGALAAWSMVHGRLAAADGAARSGARLPYGAAIAAGGLVTAALLQLR